MNLTELLHNKLKTDIKYICVNITTITDQYNLCFIDYEDYEKLGVYITGSDGRERFLIIYKDQIVALQVVYENDIRFEKKDKVDVMIQWTPGDTLTWNVGNVVEQ